MRIAFAGTFYRLCVFRIEVPALRERRQDRK